MSQPDSKATFTKPITPENLQRYRASYEAVLKKKDSLSDEKLTQALTKLKAILEELAPSVKDDFIGSTKVKKVEENPVSDLYLEIYNLRQALQEKQKPASSLANPVLTEEITKPAVGAALRGHSENLPAPASKPRATSNNVLLKALAPSAIMAVVMYFWGQSLLTSAAYYTGLTFLASLAAYSAVSLAIGGFVVAAALCAVGITLFGSKTSEDKVAYAATIGAGEQLSVTENTLLFSDSLVHNTDRALNMRALSRNIEPRQVACDQVFAHPLRNSPLR